MRGPLRSLRVRAVDIAVSLIPGWADQDEIRIGAFDQEGRHSVRAGKVVRERYPIQDVSIRIHDGFPQPAILGAYPEHIAALRIIPGPGRLNGFARPIMGGSFAGFHAGTDDSVADLGPPINIDLSVGAHGASGDYSESSRGIEGAYALALHSRLLQDGLGFRNAVANVDSPQ